MALTEGGSMEELQMGCRSEGQCSGIDQDKPSLLTIVYSLGILKLHFCPRVMPTE